MGKYDAYTQVERKKTKPSSHPAMDCRGEKWDNPNTSAAMYGVTSSRYDALAVRTQKQADMIRQREARSVEQSFAYEGLGVRQSGRNKRVDPDMGASRLEKDMHDEAVRTGGAGRKREATPRGSEYTGTGVRMSGDFPKRNGRSLAQAITHEPPATRIKHKAPGAKRAVMAGDLVAAQITSR